MDLDLPAPGPGGGEGGPRRAGTAGQAATWWAAAAHRCGALPSSVQFLSISMQRIASRETEALPILSSVPVRFFCRFVSRSVMRPHFAHRETKIVPLRSWLCDHCPARSLPVLLHRSSGCATAAPCETGTTDSTLGQRVLRCPRTTRPLLAPCRGHPQLHGGLLAYCAWCSTMGLYALHFRQTDWCGCCSAIGRQLLRAA